MSLMLLSPRVWLEIVVAAVLAALAWYGYNWVYDRGAAAVQAKWDVVEKQRSDAIIKAQQDAAKTTASLQSAADQQLRKKDEQIAAINAHLQSALDGLRNRPDRPNPGSVPEGSSAQSAVGCTGAQLFRSDSELLTREAARADRLLADLKQCQAQYQTVYDKLNPK